MQYGLTLPDRQDWLSLITPIMQNALGHSIAQTNFRRISEADAFLAVLNTQPPDETVATELGIAFGMGKIVFLLHEESLRASTKGRYPLNPALFTRLPGGQGWRNWYFTSIDSITGTDSPLFSGATDAFEHKWADIPHLRLFP